MNRIVSIVRDLAKIPMKSLATLMTVGVGIAVLILALSLSTAFSRNITEKLSGNGLIVTFANATYTAEGGMDIQRPGQFDENVMSIAKTDVSGVKAIAPVTSPQWRDVSVDGKTYQIRRAVGTNGEYLDVMNLKVVEGTGLQDSAVRAGSTVAVVSESLATTLFGSASAAVGKTFQPPVVDFGGGPGGPGGRRQSVAQVFTIVGVYADADEVARTAYGIADVIVPYTTLVPGDQNAAMAARFLLNTIVMRVDAGSVRTVEAQLRTALSSQYGTDSDPLALYVWEGQPNGESAMVAETRSTIATFTLIVNLLGFVLLVTGAIGILSIMIVEVLGKTRDIAVERALGATKQRIASEFFMRSVLLAAGSAVVGVLLALVFARPISNLVWPILRVAGGVESSPTVVSPVAVVVGVLSALVLGGVFGSLPVFTTFRAPIAETIREG